MDRWDPWPKDHLPFIDDYSDGASVSKCSSCLGKRPLPGDDTAQRKRPRTRSEVLADHHARRMYYAKLAHGADPFGSPPGKQGWTGTDTFLLAAGAAAIAPYAIAAAPLAVEGGLIAGRLARRNAAKALAQGRAVAERTIRNKIRQIGTSKSAREAMELLKDINYLLRSGKINIGRKLVRLMRRASKHGKIDYYNGAFRLKIE